MATRQRSFAVRGSVRAAQGRGHQGPRRQHAVVGVFEQQTQEYRDSVLPPDVTARVSVEQARRSAGSATSAVDGQTIGMKTFGARLR